MFKFIKQEWKYWLTSPMLWIFLFINTLLILGAVSSDNINVGGSVGSVHKNAPFVIQNYYGVMSLIGLLMITAFMNASASRDFQYGMYQFVFSSPIKKRDYYFGKFIGAATAAIIPLLGVSMGALLGPLMPWAQPERYGEVNWSGHLQGLLTFGIPNTIIAGVLLYCIAVIFRSNIVSFVGAMLILVFYVVSSGFTRDLEKEWLANLLDPFGFRPESIMSKYMTVAEKNEQTVPLSGALLTNRLIWMAISCVTLVAVYFRFSFNTRAEKPKKKKQEKTLADRKEFVSKPFHPESAGKMSLGTLFNLVRFETRAIIRNPTFIIIIVIGLINLIASLTSFTNRFGTDQYPVTYDVIDSIRGSFYLFLIAVITFYTGVLVWKERDSKINEIQDATPVRTGLLFSSKLIAMLLTVALVQFIAMLVGITAQTFFGYFRYEIGVYLKSLLLIDLFGFGFLVVIALLFHYLINNRYVAYFAFILFIILNQFIWGLFEVNSNMLKFGGVSSVTYSDMNGFGPFVPSLIGFNLYWTLFCVLISIAVFAFYVRGKEYNFRQRAMNARLAIAKNRPMVFISAILFLTCAGFVYYNTKVLNTYDSPAEEETKQVEYEKAYKKYETLEQPRYYRFDYAIDLEPYQRNMRATVLAWARNVSAKPIPEIHFTLPFQLDSVNIQIAGANLKLNDSRLSYMIYRLGKALQPNDSVLIRIDVVKKTKGFENEVSFTKLTQNGTFFNNTEIVPSFGYNGELEISDKNKRTKLKLPARKKLPKLDEKDLPSRMCNVLSDDADWVDVTTTISTAPDQIAIAPGSLLKTWEAQGKKYFTYKIDHASLNFYSFISARYEVAREKWNGIDLEVYYSKEHAYNVTDMIRSMRGSLDYYTKNFGPYYHKQCRIIEFPRYGSFAQAFPGTMPYSEGIGFIIDLRDVKKDDIDQVYYVVAHEMGHQYWAHQFVGPMMQGSELMSEGFAQYSALMVMEKEYGKGKMHKFLKYEMDGYLKGRSSEREAEGPLMHTENQPYIHYQKASVVMYYLKEMIGEDRVNRALHSLIDSFAYKNPPYATSWSAIRAFRRETPDSLQYLIDDMFENITIFSNRVVQAKCLKTGNEYEVTFTTESEKFRADSLGKETAVKINDYIDIGVFAEAEEDHATLGKPLLLQRVKISKKENSFSFRVKEKPYRVGIDPYAYLIDRMPEDNVKKPESE